MNDTKAWTASGDGTSRKGANIGSRFATFPPVPFEQTVEGVTPGMPFRQFIGFTREVNHKTSTQFENWLTIFDDVATIHNDSPSGGKNPITLDYILREVTGYSGDHAADQKKLAKEFCTRKREAAMSVRGIEVMMSKPAEEVEGVLTEKFLEVLSGVGGWEGWGKLATEDQLRQLEDLARATRCHFGEVDFAKLPELQRRIEVLFTWSGCAMHKDLNTFKAGASRLAKFWREAGLGGPTKLLSRGQEEALAEGDDAEDDMERAGGGAVKLTSLIGALVNNKEETKGCSEEFRIYTHDHLGDAIAFPDTSNTRYQCYGDAASEVIQHPVLYIDFINWHGTKKKRAAGPNHMEKNILKGLEDPPTWTELAVLTLYNESVSKPYAMEVRGSVNEWKNALDLGPLHDDLQDHCDAVADNPELLIGNNVSHTTGAFYGTLWDQPVIDHIISIRDQLPHLRDALVAFFDGACEKWPDFTDEFETGSEISQMTAEERALAFRSPTNDHNEGACAMWKQWSRRAPTMATHQKSARVQVQINGHGLLDFSHNLSQGDLAFSRRRGRDLDAAKRPLKEMRAQAVADHEAVEEERRGAEKRARKREEREARESEMVEGFRPVLDLNWFRSTPVTQLKKDTLRRQLVWHRVVDGDTNLPTGLFTSMNRETMRRLVVEALERRGKNVVVDETAPSGNQMDTDAALLSDESELELELVDEIGLNLDINADKPSPNLAHGHTPAPGPSDSSTSTPVTYRFGCKWDPINYSCSYDCVFTAFAWVYFHATEHWRTTWTGESAAAKTLSHHFKTVLRALEKTANNRSDRSIATLFSCGRDAFRDILSGEDPTMFKRCGRVNAYLADILVVLSRGQTSSRYFSFITSCGGPNCRIKITTPAGAPFMLSTNNWIDITQSNDPPYRVPLQEWITRYFDHKASSISRHCPQCSGERSLTRSFLQPPWIWFDVFADQTHVALPSFDITLSSHTYRLAAVMYGNSLHFIARLGTPSGTWWRYDGQVNGGQPVVDSITCEEDFITCGDGYTICALVYCPTR